MKILKLKRKYYRYRVKEDCSSCGNNLSVNYNSQVNGNTVLGDNVNFNGLRVSGSGRVIIGNNFHSGQDCLFITQNHNYEGERIPYDNTNVIKEIVIEDNVWIGDRVIVLGGNTIGEGAIIQAGGVVSSDIPACAIAGGNPARVYKYRDKEHYYKLKKAQKFH